MRQITITLTSAQGDVTRKNIVKPQGQPVQLAISAGTTVDIVVQGEAARKSNVEKNHKPELKFKQIGKNLIVEGDEEALVEITDFYDTPNTSVKSVSWNYAEPAFGADVNTLGVASVGGSTVEIGEAELLALQAPAGLAALEVLGIGAVAVLANAATAINAVTAPVGGVAPTLTISDSVAGVTATGAVQYTFTFSEAVSGFNVSKVTLSGGAAGTLTKVNDSTYTLIVTPAANSTGTLSVTVATAGVSDLAGNAITQTTGLSATQAYNTQHIAADTIAPTLLITDNVGVTTATGGVLYTFTFSEAVSGFDANKVAISGGTAGIFTKINDSSYTLLVMPEVNATGTLSVTVATNGVTDISGNVITQTTGLTATQAYNTVGVVPDATVPLLYITDNVATSVVKGAVLYTFTFSEDVTGFDISKVQITGGTAGAFAKETDRLYTLNVTPTDNATGQLVVSVAADAASDMASHTLGASVSTTHAFDTTFTTWSIEAATPSVDESGSFITYTVSRTGSSGQASIDFKTAGGTAAAGNGTTGDYTAVSQTLSFAAGEMQKTVTVAVRDDAEVEPDETSGAFVTNASSGTIASGVATATILDNDQSIWSVAAATLKVDEGAGFITYIVSRTGSSGPASINFKTAGGTATGGDGTTGDYTVVNQTLSFAAGEMQKTVTVAVRDDAEPEDNGTVTASILNASTGSISTNSGAATTTILDNDQSTWSVTAASSTLGEGSGFISYTVSRSGSSGQASIDFKTAGGTATAGNSTTGDYTAVSQTLSFAAGEIQKNVTVAVRDDADIESDETVTASIANATTGNIATASAAITIIDNEQSVWKVTSGSSNLYESAGALVWTVSRTGTSDEATIHFQTANGSAEGGNDTTGDYTSTSQTMHFAAGEMSKNVHVALHDDSIAEPSESLYGVISDASTGTIASYGSQVLILDDDQSIWDISTPSSYIDESGQYLTFIVRRNGKMDAATIDFKTTGGASATGGDGTTGDYTAVNQTLSFAAGEMQKIVTVAVREDSVKETNETFLAGISNASNGTIDAETILVTIMDNDQFSWSMAASTATVDEGAGFITYTVTRTGSSGIASIDFKTGGGTATAGNSTTGDYTPLSQTLNFADGEAKKNVTVAIRDDAVFEVNETVVASIANATAGTIVTTNASVKVIDNDQSVWAVEAVGPSLENASSSLVFVVSRTGANGDASIDFKTLSSSATANSDYTPLSATLHFAAGEIQKTLYVPVLADSEEEANEILVGVIGNATTGSIATSSAEATIVDDDTLNWSISVSTSTVDEGAGFITYLVSRTTADVAASIDINTLGGTAIGGNGTTTGDYTPYSQTLNFAVGELAKAVTVAVRDDADAEVSETVIAGLSNPSTGRIDISKVTAVIRDNELMQWTISAATLTVDEGAEYVVYNITRVSAFDAATIEFATVGGSAVGGADFTSTHQMLSFADGEAAKVVRVAINNDNLAEWSETIIGAIGNASAGSISTTNATATILDNDQSTWTVVNNVLINESAGYTAYQVSRTGPLNDATVEFSTESNALIAGVDYTPTHQTLRFAAGEAMKTVFVAVANNTVSNVSKALYGVLTNATTGNLIASAVAVAVTDDADTTHVKFAISVSNTDESAAVMNYAITRTGDLTGTQTVDYYISGGTAVAGTGGDYTNVSGSATFAQGVNTVLVSVPLLEDTAVDGSKTIIMTLRNASGGTIKTTSATGSIADNEPSAVASSYSMGSFTSTVNEGTGTVGVNITRSGDSSQAEVVYFRTLDGTALAGSDFVGTTSQTLNWQAGEKIKMVFVDLINDAIFESDKSFTVQVSKDVAFTSISSATVTITDDDAITQGTVSYAMASPLGTTVLESAGDVAFTITRSGDLTQSSTSYFRTNGGTGDFTAITSQTLNWSVGESVKTVLVHLNDDGVNEIDQTVIGQITTDATFSAGLSTLTMTVMDDDSYTANAGVADTFTIGTASGSYGGGRLIDTGDGNDAVTVAASQMSWSMIKLGDGDDTLTGSMTNLFVDGAHYIGGNGMDTLNINSAGNLSQLSLSTAGDMFAGFEILNFGTGNQINTMSLSDILEFVKGNAVSNTLRVNGTSGDQLKIQALGKTLTTAAAGSTIIDVDGQTYTVQQSAAGNTNTNDVSIGGVTYDVYQYNHDGQMLKLLMATAMTTTMV